MSVPAVPKELLQPWRSLDVAKLTDLAPDHPYVRQRRKYIRERWRFLHQFVPECLCAGSRAIDVSCGGGGHLEILQWYGVEAVGVDWYYGRQGYGPLLKSQGLDCVLHDCSQTPYPFADREFDLLLNFNAITCYGQPEIWPRVLGEFARITGQCIVFSVNRGEKYERGKHYIEGWAADHRRVFTVERWGPRWKLTRRRGDNEQARTARVRR